MPQICCKVLLFIAKRLTCTVISHTDRHALSHSSWIPGRNKSMASPTLLWRQVLRAPSVGFHHTWPFYSCSCAHSGIPITDGRSAGKGVAKAMCFFILRNSSMIRFFSVFTTMSSQDMSSLFEICGPSSPLKIYQKIILLQV